MGQVVQSKSTECNARTGEIAPFAAVPGTDKISASVIYSEALTAAGRPLSQIEAHEEIQAVSLVHDEFTKLAGKMPPKPCGFYVLMRIFIRPGRSPGGILYADMTLDEDKYQSVAGLVIDMGPDAYRDKDRFPNGKWCKIGDWVTVPAYEGFKFSFRGVPLRMHADDQILSVIEDPMDVMPQHLADGRAETVKT